MNRNKFILILLVFVSGFSQAQLHPHALHYRTRIDESALYLKDTITVHSSVLPVFSRQERNTSSPIQMKTNLSPSLRIYAIGDLTIGGEYMKNNTRNPKYTGGIGLGIDYSGQQFYAGLKLMPYTTETTYVRDSVISILNTDLGTTRPISGNWFQRSEVILAWQAKKFFTLSGGYGKHFFGEGYRSLLLSDNASSYPFFKAETDFGGIKYVNLYSIWNDNAVNPADKSLDQMKFSATHYLSWNITREFNLSIFESVVWQKDDTLIDRGFDFNYLNPIVFYRPVEYSNGSSDNVLLGLNTSFKFNKNHTVYAQVILDEFLLKEIKAKNHWWGNKYGFQLGYKSNNFFAENLFAQFELNMVRPFTYSHKHSVLSYGHLNAPVAHPTGANFYEALNIMSYAIGDHRITHKFTYSSFGIDTSATSYGQNIFASYSNRDGNYDHLTMQGFRQTVLNETLIFETPFIRSIDLYASFIYNYRMQWNPTETIHTHSVMIGIRTRFWNIYDDH